MSLIATRDIMSAVQVLTRQFSNQHVDRVDAMRAIADHFYGCTQCPFVNIQCLSTCTHWNSTLVIEQECDLKVQRYGLDTEFSDTQCGCIQSLIIH